MAREYTTMRYTVRNTTNNFRVFERDLDLWYITDNDTENGRDSAYRSLDALRRDWPDDTFTITETVVTVNR